MEQWKLVKEARKGNGEAFQQLLETHSERLYRTAYLYTGNRQDALDIVQETAYNAFRSIGQLKNPKYFLTWITRILIHCAYEVLDKKKKELPVDHWMERQMEDGKQPDHAHRLDLADAVNHLKRDYQTAVVLYYYEDLKIKEIAAIMDVPENTVKTYLSRAKRDLKRRLGGAGGYEQAGIS
ncbi:MAG TPA: sigma-70 family RNA polymerase sigma factor [Bacillales bacterium]|nr:sigma-70 family RNA polymerase sigma factor [Bacillales bacterium]